MVEAVHTCPRCELRFERETELRAHLASDHGVEVDVYEPYHYEGRSTRPPRVPDARRFLVVANQTLHATELEARIRELAAGGPARFHVIVPADVPGGDRSPDARQLVANRLHHLIDLLHDDGIDAEGEIGRADPFHAVEDTLERHEVDEIVLSTLPAGLSRWLAADLPRRLERTFHLPVTHTEASVQPGTA